MKFSIVGGNEGETAQNVSGYDVDQAQIAFVAGAAAAMLPRMVPSATLGVWKYPQLSMLEKSLATARNTSTPTLNTTRTTPAILMTLPSRRRRHLLRSRRVPTSIATAFLNLGLRGMEQAARKGTHIIGSYTNRCGTDPLYVAYSITGVGFQVQYAINEVVAGSWTPGYKEFGT